jgi:hypothetical protein
VHGASERQPVGDIGDLQAAESRAPDTGAGGPWEVLLDQGDLMQRTSAPRPDGHERAPAMGGALAGSDRDLADADQASADRDQAAADRDQATADRDQLASDRDQAASDRNLAAGGDPLAHALSRDLRRRSARDREHAARARREAADRRAASARPPAGPFADQPTVIVPDTSSSSLPARASPML